MFQQTILDNSMLPTLWEQFGEGSFLFQHGCGPVHKVPLRHGCVSFVQKNLSGLHRALSSNPSNTFGMNQNGARPSGSISVPVLINGWKDKHSHRHTPKYCGKPSQRSESCHSCKGGTNSMLIPLAGVMARCQYFWDFFHIVFTKVSSFTFYSK